MEKLGGIIHEYRLANYAQTVPTRFAKEVVTAADANKDGVITADEVLGLLKNIGAAGRMTQEEVDMVMVEAGIEGEIKSVPVAEVMEMILNAEKQRASQ